MIAISLRLQMKPNKRDELVEFLKWDADVAREHEPGTLRFDVFADGEHEDSLLLYKAYESEEAFEFHKQQEPFKKFADVRAVCVESMDVIVGGAIPVATNFTHAVGGCLRGDFAADVTKARDAPLELPRRNP